MGCRAQVGRPAGRGADQIARGQKSWQRIWGRFVASQFRHLIKSAAQSLSLSSALLRREFKRGYSEVMFTSISPEIDGSNKTLEGMPVGIAPPATGKTPGRQVLSSVSSALREVCTTK